MNQETNAPQEVPSNQPLHIHIHVYPQPREQPEPKVTVKFGSPPLSLGFIMQPDGTMAPVQSYTL